MPSAEFWTPTIGQRFVVDADLVPKNCDRRTRTDDGQCWIWADDERYPLEHCQRIAMDPEISAQFALELEVCGTYSDVTALLNGLYDEHRRDVWTCCSRSLRASIHQLKTEAQPPQEGSIEFAPVASQITA
jgi:hypothetical protein